MILKLFFKQIIGYYYFNIILFKIYFWENCIFKSKIFDFSKIKILTQKILIEFNIQKILKNYHKISGQTVFNNYHDMFLYYFAITLNKSIRFNYPPSFKDYFKNSNQFLLDRNDLINLDILKIAKLYTNKENGPTNRVGLGLFGKNLEQRFDYDYPIVKEFAYISPHHYNYDKKYIKIYY